MKQKNQEFILFNEVISNPVEYLLYEMGGWGDGGMGRWGEREIFGNG
ncbi:MAG: hypothetical protein F6K48_25145 [Okeania sp. SIO3H1]|nr:hypothetical protein [Okeania sp. SIO3H1]